MTNNAVFLGSDKGKQTSKNTVSVKALFSYLLTHLIFLLMLPRTWAEVVNNFTKQMGNIFFCFIQALIESQIYIGHMLYTSIIMGEADKWGKIMGKKVSNSYKPTKSLISLN